MFQVRRLAGAKAVLVVRRHALIQADIQLEGEDCQVADLIHEWIRMVSNCFILHLLRIYYAPKVSSLGDAKIPVAEAAMDRDAAMVHFIETLHAQRLKEWP